MLRLGIKVVRRGTEALETAEETERSRAELDGLSWEILRSRNGIVDRGRLAVRLRQIVGSGRWLRQI